MFFIAGHSIQIYLLLSQKMTIQLTEEEEELYSQAFLPHGFTPKTFRSMADDAQMEFRAIKKGGFLYKQGDEIDSVGFLVQGGMEANRDGNVYGRVLAVKGTTPGAPEHNGGWCGEFWDDHYDFSKEHRYKEDSFSCPIRVSFLPLTFRIRWKVSFVATEDSKVAVWNKKKLYDAIGHGSQSTQLAANHAQIQDLWQKLRSKEVVKTLETYKVN